ncbi:phospholipid-transporting ATPase ABCA3-like isoform X2 [Periplaneta americana]|uniref:phospholipid-transporting ATPase ABCA3-like isoform X2 n=1 Tax=Periplaneta americana TaxID=6978 RepID=UPI0037E70A83
MVLTKFFLIMWKNVILRLRHYILTTIEVVLPIILFILAAVVRSEMVGFDRVVDIQYFEITDEWTLLNIFTSKNYLLYAPPTDFTTKLVTEVNKVMKCEMKEFETEDELMSFYNNEVDHITSRGTYAIVFQDLPPQDDLIPIHLKYKIRIPGTFSTAKLFSDFMSVQYYDEYHYSHFLTLQVLLDKAFMEEQHINSSGFQFAIQKFPYPEHKIDLLVQVFSAILPSFMVISFVMLCPSILKRIVEEKQTGAKELMKMMGLKNWMLWLGWMVNAMIVNIITVTLITIFLKVAFGNIAVFPNSDFFLVWLTLIFYTAGGVTFLFTISSFFSRPTLAMSVGVLLWLVSYFATSFLVVSETDISFGIKMLTAILPNTAISWAFQIILKWENQGYGLSWGNILKSPTGTEDDIGMIYIWIMFFVDIVVYSILTWYIDSVMPGKYGLAKPWYFFVMPSYWCSRKVSAATVSTDDHTEVRKTFEQPHSNLHVGIKIQNLRKIFQSLGGLNKKVAVDGVTLDIYRGEITALLGHNGAGKTTTMSILTGMYSASSGSVYIDGYDIHESLDKVRESLRLCPQHNLLFTDLTVLEHLLFFAMLKGRSKKEAEVEALELLQRLNLANKQDSMSSTLSGGMKRKLSLGIALIGHTKVLMLDEPTSGMDPEARREIWDLLLSMRGERTILLTTHYMEEADVLGDRIAIMDHGRVQCYGTSMFLKKLYGTGYQLNLLKEEGCSVNRITEAIQQTIPDAKIKTEMNTLLSYMLPSEQTHHFPSLFDVLERDKQKLGISSIGVCITTLEEVFLRVGKEAEEDFNRQRNVDNVGHGTETRFQEGLQFKKSVGAALILQQLKALFMKRITFIYRKWLAFTLQALIAILLAVLTVVLSADSGSPSEPERVLSLSEYGSSNVLYSPHNIQETWSIVYSNVIKILGSNPEEITEQSLTHALVHYGEDLNTYLTRYIVGAEFNLTTISYPYQEKVKVLNAMYSSVALHAAPISLNLLSNAVLQDKSPELGVTVINHPLQRKVDFGATVSLTLAVMMLWMTLMPFGLLFLTGNFMRFPLLERVTKAKQLQLMTGVSPLAYWSTCFICDFLCYLVVAALMLLAVFLGDPLDIFSRPEELGLILSFIIYALVSSKEYEAIGNGLKYILQLLPHFSLSFGFLRFSQQVLNNYECKLKKNTYSCSVTDEQECCQPGCRDGFCPAKYKPYLAFATSANENAIGEEILYMIIDAVLYFGLVLLIEYNAFAFVNNAIMKSIFRSQASNEILEQDVWMEKDRVSNKLRAYIEQDDGDSMLVYELAKTFKRNFAAVKGVSFGVGRGECFGLLGVNGAGKTTTFRMLTGDEVPSAGDAWIPPYGLTDERRKFLAQIGYCPQFDAINEALTGREMLALFANLRGVSTVDVNNEVNKWITQMGLTEYENRQCGTYSGGNKRKLNAAMALIGNPPIIFLDEPTSGVDPVSRRKLWNVMSSVQKSGQSIVLTSHSMEECEALCNRLAIMVGGQFMCMGSTQYLKQKYGQGFTVVVKLKAGSSLEAVSSLKNEIENSFNPGCILKDEHQGMLHYHVTNPNTPWKHLFNTMEHIKRNFVFVEDYTISETTLEQVFLSFAKTQVVLLPPIYVT